MNVPFADLQAQYRSLKNDIDAAISGVIASSQFILGRAVLDFEAAFARAHDVRSCIAVGSGTDALHLSLWALGIGPGDFVVTSPFTFIATVEAITLTGATPLFADIDARMYTLDPDRFRAVLDGHRHGGIKAVIPVHLYGQPAMMEELKAAAAPEGVAVIEDACQAHLAQYENTPVGNFGSAAAFSFYPAKNLGAFGEAGAVVTNDDRLAATIRSLRDHGQSAKYTHQFGGHNYRMDGIQGAVLGAKLKHLKEWTARRREIAAAYREKLAGVGDLVLPFESPKVRHVYHHFVVRTGRREELRQFLQEKSVSTSVAYPIPLHLQPAYAGLGYHRGDLPVSEQIGRECLSLPVYPELSPEQIEYVCDSVKAFFAD